MTELIRISEIKISEDRIRRKFERIDELAASIKLVGLIEPIIIDREFNLICGERRVKAHLQLGEEMIRAEFSDEIDPWKMRMIELEENLRRQDLTYSEECEAKLQLHELYQARYGVPTTGPQRDERWGVDDTAELTGDSHGAIVGDLKLARAMRIDPSLRDKDSKTAALRAMEVGSDLQMRKEIAEILSQHLIKDGDDPIQILHGDSAIILPQFPDESFDFCITDPPYGIGLHDIQNTFPNRGEVRGGVEFDDSVDILEVVGRVMKEVYRVLKVGSHCYVFFAIARFTEMKKILQEVGFWVQPTPIFWKKNNALNLKPHICFPVDYEPCFYCSKGYPPRPFPEIQHSSIFEYPVIAGVKKVHPAEKNLDLIKMLVGLCSQPLERGIDPFLGGGTFTLALKQMGRIGVGVELDSNWWLRSKERLEGENE